MDKVFILGDLTWNFPIWTIFFSKLYKLHQKGLYLTDEERLQDEFSWMFYDVVKICLYVLNWEELMIDMANRVPYGFMKVPMGIRPWSVCVCAYVWVWVLLFWWETLLRKSERQALNANFVSSWQFCWYVLPGMDHMWHIIDIFVYFSLLFLWKSIRSDRVSEA